MRYLIATCVLVLLFGSGVQATGQFPDRIIYRDTECAVATDWQWPSLLQIYYLVNKNYQYPYQSTSTACYRGHIATWAIEEGKLFLLKLEVRESVPYGNSRRMTTRTLVLPDALRRKMAGDKVFVDWFTGFITVYDSTDTFTLVKIERGMVLAEKSYTETACNALNAAYNTTGSSGVGFFDQERVYMKKLVQFQAGTISAADMDMVPEPVDWPVVALIILPGALLALVVIGGWYFYSSRKNRRRGEPPTGINCG